MYGAFSTNDTFMPMLNFVFVRENMLDSDLRLHYFATKSTLKETSRYSYLSNTSIYYLNCSRLVTNRFKILLHLWCMFHATSVNL